MSSPSARPANSVPNPNPTQNLSPPARKKSLKLDSSSRSGSSNGGSGSSTAGNDGDGPTLQQPASVEIGQSVPERQSALEQSPRGSRTGGVTSQPHGGGDQHRSYGGNRRGNSSGGSHYNHGNRRDQEWNHHRSAHMQHPQQRGGSGGIRSYPWPPMPGFGPPPPVGPFAGNAIGFPGK